MEILILGDVGASVSNVEAFCKGADDLFSEDIQEKCNNADIVILNLEKPLTDVANPLGICPPDYIAPTMSVNGLLLLHPTAVTLANNHILDQKEAGLESTMKVLQDNKIFCVGAGRNAKEAREPLLFKCENKTIGFYACCEKEFSFSTDKRAGANAFDPLYSFDDISSLKARCDHLIILFHGGMQNYPYPSPRLQAVCHKMCEKGADLVVCQHSHIIGCEEEYCGSRIVYGQGNFLLDEKEDPNWQTGLMIEEKWENNQWKTTYYPIETCNHKTVFKQNASEVLDLFRERSNEILDTEKLRIMYQELCQKKLPEYLIKMHGMEGLSFRVFRKFGLIRYISKLFYRKPARNRILDYLYCDAHREAIETGLNNNF